MNEVEIAITRRRVSWRWLLVLAVIIWFTYATRGVIAPFLAGLVIAYLLDPLTTKLERRGIRRWASTLIVLTIFFGLFAGLVLAATPLLIAQLEQLAHNLPQIIESIKPLLEKFFLEAGDYVDVSAFSGDLVNKGVNWVTGVASNVLAGGLKVFNVLALIIIMPVVAFYTLRDYDHLTSRIDQWWPRRYATTIRQLLGEADASLAGFIRGQSLVCLVLAIFYAIAWSLTGLDYALVLGMLAGLLGFVPYIGVIVSVGLALLVGFGQWGFDPAHLGLVLGVFFVGQIMEGSVLTPNLIGNRIGLHPLWVLFAVFAGGELMGILGVFLAVPVAAVIGVVVRWLLSEYLVSPLYDEDLAAPEEPAVDPQ